MELYITSIDQQGRVAAIVDIDYGASFGEYEVTGLYEANSRCRSLQLTPTATAWLTSHPADVVALQLSGRLTDDGATYLGQMNMNPHCRCLGRAAPHESNPRVGASCDAWDGPSGSWCYVASQCPEAVVSASAGWYRAACDIHENCTSFAVARMCSVQPVLCPAGWVQHNYRYVDDVAPC